MPIKDYVTGATNKILIGTGGIGLIITAIVGLSGRTPAYQTRDSSGQNTWGVTVDGTSTQSGTIATKSLLNCNTIDTTSTGMLICGTDASGAGGSDWSGTGALQTAFDGRYVNTSGDTMTGSLKILNNSSLQVAGSITGSIIKAVTSLSSSGTLVFEGAASGSSLFLGTSLTGAGLSDCDTAGTSKLLWDVSTGRFTCGTDTDTNTTYTFGQGLTTNGTLITLTPFHSGSTIWATTALRSSGSLVWEGVASGATLYLGGSLQGVGLTDCDLATQTLNWDVTTGRFSCGTDADTNTTYTAGDGLDLTSTSFSLSDSISGTLLEFQTVSGSTVYGSKSLRSSGSLVWEGAASGATLYVATSIQGAGLVDCDLATQTLAWDTSAGRFSCGTDSDTTYTAGQGLTLTSTSFRLSDTISGTLLEFQTVSGSTVYASKSVRSSGALVWEGAGSGNNLNLAGGAVTISNVGLTVFNELGRDVDFRAEGDNDTGLFFLDASTDRIGIGTQTPDTKLDVIGTISGALVTINGAGTSYFLSNVAIGATTTSERLEVIGTASGTVLYAKNSLRSSGSLVFEGAGSGASLTATTLSGTIVRARAFSPRHLGVYVFATGSTITTGSGKAMITIGDPAMSGSYIKAAHLSVQTSGTTNTTSVQIRNAAKGNRKVFSTVLSIDSAETGSDTAATPAVISTANRDVGAYDRLIVDIPSVSTTAPKGDMILILEFYKP